MKELVSVGAPQICIHGNDSALSSVRRAVRVQARAIHLQCHLATKLWRSWPGFPLLDNVTDLLPRSRTSRPHSRHRGAGIRGLWITQVCRRAR
jgi:hypothetical protein